MIILSNSTILEGTIEVSKKKEGYLSEAVELPEPKLEPVRSYESLTEEVGSLDSVLIPVFSFNHSSTQYAVWP